MYILSNKYRTTFYIGVTSSLKKRMEEHTAGTGSTFTKKYNVKDLLYYEEFSHINQAIQKEKQLKNWHRDWKLNLVRAKNPIMSTLKI